MAWKKRLAVVVMSLIGALFALMALVPASSAAPLQQGPLIKVYFPKLSDQTVNHVYWVYRTVPNTGSTGITTWTFSLQFILAGPTLSERATYGLYSEWNEILSGPSNCSKTPGGPDFTVIADHKGPKVAPGTETVKFCRTATPPGDLTPFRIIAQISATLKQFPGVKNVVVLTKDGHCFGDLSGQDQCLK